MAKSGVFDTQPTLAAKATELKRELQKLVKEIADDEDVGLEAIDRAQQMLCVLKEMKLKNSISLKALNPCFNDGAVPEEFKCPLSKELMRDPVIIASGQTYDRIFIQKRLQSGNRTCPCTQQVLTNTFLTPNHLVRQMIAQWCKNHGIKLPDSAHCTKDGGATEADRSTFMALLKKMSSTPSDQKEAAKELRLSTKRVPAFRALFGESQDSIPQMLSPLSTNSSQNDGYLELQEDIITTLLNLSIHDSNKKLVTETPMVLPTLMDALKSGTIETRSNAAATLFTLSALDSNKALIGGSGALKPLIDLLDEGHSLAMKDAASAIFNLCILNENKLRTVRVGAVGVILKKILNGMHVDELLSILAMLSSIHKAIEEMGELGAVPGLFSVIKETSCIRNQENCIAILHNICFNDRSKLKELQDEEDEHGTISQLAQNGTSRAKRKAYGILEKLNRAKNLALTA